MSNCLLWQGAFSFQMRASQAPSSFPWLSSTPLLILWTPPPPAFDVFPGLPCPAAAHGSGCPSDADVWKSEGVPCVPGDPGSFQDHQLSLSIPAGLWNVGAGHMARQRACILLG